MNAMPDISKYIDKLEDKVKDMDVEEIKLKNPLRKKQGINPIVVGAAGLVVGAGVAAAIALSRNKKLQKKVAGVVGDVANKSKKLAVQLTDNDLSKKDNLKDEKRKIVKKIKTKTK